MGRSSFGPLPKPVQIAQGGGGGSKCRPNQLLAGMFFGFFSRFLFRFYCCGEQHWSTEWNGALLALPVFSPATFRITPNLSCILLIKDRK